MSTEYLDLADYIAIVTAATGLDEGAIFHVAALGLADSALHAPAAEFEGSELYPDFIDKAAVLLVRLVQNHALPDGNKRVAWVALRLFVELNGWEWETAPLVDEAERAVLAVAAGEWREPEAADWLRSFLIR